jgi:hypothetical protein
MKKYFVIFDIELKPSFMSYYLTMCFYSTMYVFLKRFDVYRPPIIVYPKQVRSTWY